jgi:3-(3-hydroxy-phenyl)propionate hydroxylase
MQSTYTYPQFDYRQSEGATPGRIERHPVVVVGAGPVGLTAALECAARACRWWCWTTTIP